MERNVLVPKYTRLLPTSDWKPLNTVIVMFYFRFLSVESGLKYLSNRGYLTVLMDQWRTVSLFIGAAHIVVAVANQLWFCLAWAWSKLRWFAISCIHFDQAQMRTHRINLPLNLSCWRLVLLLIWRCHVSTANEMPLCSYYSLFRRPMQVHTREVSWLEPGLGGRDFFQQTFSIWPNDTSWVAE